MSRKKVNVSSADLISAMENYPHAGEAAKSLGLTYSTFARRCGEFGLQIKSNQGRKGIKVGRTKEYAALVNKASIKRWMIEEGTPNECSECKIPPIWQGKPLSFHLDHIDGNRTNNDRNNLRLMCPNCHSQTPTWGSKNIKR